jgi:hypothetical protein
MKFDLIAGYLRGGYWEGPDRGLTSGQELSFSHLFEALKRNTPGSLLPYRLEYPKHEFLTYLVEYKNILLHGSNVTNIRHLIPFRLSTSDHNWEKRNAIYAFSDGILPIFYAVLDRANYRDSIRDDVAKAIDDVSGETRKYYYFSLSIAMLTKQVWKNGMIYILDRSPFEQLKDDSGDLLDEWTCSRPVPVLARLPVSPADFPFLTRVLVHTERSASDAPARRQVDPRVYDALVGRYAAADDFVLTISKLNERIFVEAPGYKPFEMSSLSETEYFVELANARLTFRLDGDVTRLTLQMDGKTMVAIRRS